LKIFLFLFLLAPLVVSGEENTAAQLYAIHGQATLLPQWHPAFPAAYSGYNSLNSDSELDASFSTSLFLGLLTWEGGYFYSTSEVTGGRAFSDLAGIAAFPNDDLSRTGDGNPVFNQAEVYFQQVIGLGGEKETIDEESTQLSANWDISRIVLTAGKFIQTDFLDGNDYAHDPRTQFMNLGLVDNAAWDFASNVYGDTWALLAELNQKVWSLRLCSAMVADAAIGENLDGNIAQARGDSLELEWRYGDENNAGKISALGYLNHARMGNYRDAVELSTGTPDITLTRGYSQKYGVGINWHQSFNQVGGLFARLGWNDGQREAWAQTSVDQTLSWGGTLKGGLWGRPDDQMGLGFVVSGLSAEHQAYLTAGGNDFGIGDGALHYAPEGIAELYYLYKPVSYLGLTLDLQFVANPAFNQDRGPVFITAGRIHIE